MKVQKGAILVALLMVLNGAAMANGKGKPPPVNPNPNTTTNGAPSTSGTANAVIPGANAPSKGMVNGNQRAGDQFSFGSNPTSSNASLVLSAKEKADAGLNAAAQRLLAVVATIDAELTQVNGLSKEDAAGKRELLLGIRDSVTDLHKAVTNPSQELIAAIKDPKTNHTVSLDKISGAFEGVISNISEMNLDSAQRASGTCMTGFGTSEKVVKAGLIKDGLESDSGLAAGADFRNKSRNQQILVDAAITFQALRGISDQFSEDFSNSIEKLANNTQAMIQKQNEVAAVALTEEKELVGACGPKG
jgi:hypothetical protein